MSFGVIEVITLLLGLSGFGIQSNPKPPTPDQSLQYAMPDADVVMHFDAVSVVPGNYKVLKALETQPSFQSSPELKKVMTKAVTEIEGARSLAKIATGIDVVSDIHDATVFVQIVPNGKPNIVATVHGKFTVAMLDKLGATMKGKVVKLAKGSMIEVGANEPAVGVTADGVMLAGTASLVRDRLAETWKAPARAAGSNLAYAAEVLGQKPVYALVLTMSPGARSEVTKNMGPKNFVSDLVQRHKMASFSLFRDGIGWMWIDNSKAGLDAMAMMSEGTLEVLKAAQIAPRGMAKIMLGGLESYRGDKQVDDLLKHKKDVLTIVNAYTGNGNFKTKIDKDPKNLKLSVRATGKSLTEVVPAGLLLPGMAWGFLVRGSDQQQVQPMRVTAPPARQPVPPRPPTPGLGGPKKK